MRVELRIERFNPVSGETARKLYDDIKALADKYNEGYAKPAADAHEIEAADDFGVDSQWHDDGVLNKPRGSRPAILVPALHVNDRGLSFRKVGDVRACGEHALPDVVGTDRLAAADDPAGQSLVHG